MTTNLLPLQTSHLRQIASSITIPALKGRISLADKRNIFPNFFDEAWAENSVYINKIGSRARTSSVYEVITDGDFMTILGSLGRDLHKISWINEEQMLVFLRTGGEKWIHCDGRATFLPFMTVVERIALDVSSEKRYDKEKEVFVDSLQAHYCRYTRWNRTLYRELGYRFAVLEPL